MGIDTNVLQSWPNSSQARKGMRNPELAVECPQCHSPIGRTCFMGPGYWGITHTLASFATKAAWLKAHPCSRPDRIESGPRHGNSATAHGDELPDSFGDLSIYLDSLYRSSLPLGVVECSVEFWSPFSASWFGRSFRSLRSGLGFRFSGLFAALGNTGVTRTRSSSHSSVQENSSYACHKNDDGFRNLLRAHQDRQCNDSDQYSGYVDQ